MTPGHPNWPPARLRPREGRTQESSQPWQPPCWLTRLSPDQPLAASTGKGPLEITRAAVERGLGPGHPGGSSYCLTLVPVAAAGKGGSGISRSALNLLHTLMHTHIHTHVHPCTCPMHEPAFLHRELPGPEGHSPTRCSHGAYPGHPSRASPLAIPQGDPGPDRPWLSSRSPRPRPSPFCLLIPVGHGGWTLQSGRLCLCVCVSRGVTCVSACL